MLYAAKCYWPGVTEAELAARQSRSDRGSYLGALLFPDDALVLCLFEAPTPALVRQASDRDGLPCERVMQTRWLPSPVQSSHRTQTPSPRTETETGREKRR